MTATLQLTRSEARWSWCARQQLAGGVSGSLADRVAALGWVPLATGANAALAMWARGAIAHRAEVDDATLVRHELAVVPGPRGMLWWLPAAHAPLARSFAVADHAAREARLAAACALTERDLAAARDAVRAALETPATPEALRGRLPASALKSLGEQGRRAGCRTLAGLVLRGLWAQGVASRAHLDGRVDGHRVEYLLDARPRIVPPAADAVEAVVGPWVAAHAPTRLRSFAAAFGLAASRATSALKHVKLREARVEGSDDAWVVPEDFELAPRDRRVVAMVPFRDPFTDAHPQLDELCDTPASARAAMLRAMGPAPAVVVDGALVATWTVQEPGLRVTVAYHAPIDDEVATRVRDVSEDLEAFLRGELGGAPPWHGRVLPRELPALAGELGAAL